jgi:broad specificity phosphatase PhoE
MTTPAHGDPTAQASTPRATHLVFVRHGEALGANGRCIGHTDLLLSPSGAVAIQILTAAWHNAGTASVTGVPTRIVSSDLRRAADSAALLAVPWDIPVEFTPQLREMHFGVWDGQPWSVIEAEDGARLQAWMEQWVNLTTPSGEDVGALMRRATKWLDTLLHNPLLHGDTTVVVSHAGWIRAALTYLLNRPISQMFDIPVGHACATIVRINASEMTLVASDVPLIP